MAHAIHSGSAAPFDPMPDSKRINLPISIVLVVLSAGMSWAASYAVTREQLRNDTYNIAQLQEKYWTLQGTVADHKIYIQHLQASSATVMATLNAQSADTRNRLERLQSDVIKMQAALEAIRQASSYRLPEGERRQQ